MKNWRATIVMSAVSAAAGFGFSLHSASAAPVSWNVNASGTWITAADWTSTPALPGPTDDVTINQPGAITVTLSSGTQSIHSFLLDNNLTLNGGTLAVATTVIVNGNLSITNGATLANATLSTAGTGAVTFNSAAFDRITLASNLPIPASSQLILEDGLTLSSTTLSLNTSSVLAIAGNQTLAGTGILEFDGAVGTINSSGGNSTLTTAPNVTIQTGIGNGTISTTAFINQGLLSAQTSGKIITISAPSFTNSGTLQALNNGTINILSSLTTAQLGSFNADPVGATTPGTIEISGILDNSSSTLALNGAANSLTLNNSGTIKNGTISTANGAVLTVAGAATFDGVTLASNLSLSNNNNPLNLKDGLTLSNVTLSLNNASALAIGNNQTLAAAAGTTGILEFDGTGTENVTNAATVLTIGANITVQTGTGNGTISPSLINQGTIAAQTSGKLITLSGSSLTNSGALQALNGATLTIISPTWSSTGTITIDSTSTLNLGGTFTTASLATLSRTGTGGNVTITGTLDNSNATFALTAATGNFTLGGSGGTIKNGNVSVTGGAVLTIGGNNTTFDNVTLTSNLPVSNTDLFIKDGLTLANTTLSFISTAALVVNGNQTISAIAGGTGILEFDGTGNTNIINSGSGILTIGPNVTVRTGTGSGTATLTGLINQGLLSAQTSGKIITINATTFANTGTIQAFNGGTISIGSALTTAQLGTFNSDPTAAPGFTTPGIIQISGTLDNSNATLALNGVGSSLTLTGTLKNGNLSLANGAVLTITGSATFDGVTLLSNLTLPNNGSFFVKDGLTLANTTLTLNNANLEITNNMTLSPTTAGVGIVEFDGGNGGIVGEPAVTLTLASNITVQTGTANGSLSPPILINQGLISAQTSGKTITIAAATSLTNTGTLQASNGGTINILSNLTTAQLGAFNSTGGTIQLSGTLDNSNATLTLNGAGNSLLLTGTIKNGNVSLAAGAQLTINAGTVPTFNVANLTVAAGGTFHQGGGNVTLAALSQSGGTISLGGAAQLLYAIPTIAITGGTTTLTTEAVKVVTTPSLTFGGFPNAWTGELDLTQNKAIVEATPTTKSALLTALENQAFFGRSNPAGIISSTITSHFAVAVIDNALLGKTTFATQPVDPNSILIAPELLGDSNIDGKVDLTDLNTVLNNLGTPNTNWTSGNFDDGFTIDLTDLNDVLNNLGTTFANPSVLSTQSSSLPTPTPEPTSFLILATAPFLLTRSKRPRTTSR